jgi:hypothetical protein
MDELRAIERGDIASVLECRPKLDRALVLAVDRLLALDKADRFPSCDAAVRALAPFGAGDMGALRLASIIADVLPASAAPLPPRSSRPIILPRAPSPRAPGSGAGAARGGDTQSASKPDSIPAPASPERVGSGPSQASRDGADLTVIEGAFGRRAGGRDEGEDGDES